MNIQVLVSTMDQEDYSLLDKMNIQTDAIVINQCDRNEVKEFNYKGNKIIWMSFNERGVGLSRNNGLMRATADICLMADDDMVYVDGYRGIVLRSFMDNQKADMIMFNVPIHKKDGTTIIKVKKENRVRFLNSMKFGTVNIGFKRDSILKKNIFFSLLFGGGAKYCSGEDSLFISDTFKKGLKIYSITEVIANIAENESTWFTGYNERYFFDRGALYEAMAKSPLSFLLIIQFIIRKKNLYSNQTPPIHALKKMLEGRKYYK